MTRLAAIQMVSSDDVAENVRRAGALIAQAADGGADFVSLPEYFCMMGETDADRLRIGEEDQHGPIQAFLAELAAAHRIWLLGGTTPIRAADGAKVRNAACVYRPDGTRAARYDKMHLFALRTVHESYDEATVLDAGSSPVVVDVAGVRTGLSVCYDLRFPELYRAMGALDPERPLDLICVPSAFTYATGSAHWELLLRARAVENLCYVMAAAQGGRHRNGRRTWGHTMIVDPWGDIVGCRAEGEGVVFATIDRDRIASVRSRLPALTHRRL